MSNVTDSHPRQNGVTGMEVGTCFITSKSYPDSNFLLSMVDLPIPSDGYNYVFKAAYSDGVLTYSYDSDPTIDQKKNPPLITFPLPPYPCSEREMTDGSLVSVHVVDNHSKAAPKTGQVSNIQFQGKFELPPAATAAAVQHKNASEPVQTNWIVNIFIINSRTQNQSFGVVTCPINSNLEGYDGPYSSKLSVVMMGGWVDVGLASPANSDVGISNGVAIGIATAPIGEPFIQWSIAPAPNYVFRNSLYGSSLSSNNPTTTL